MGGEVYRFGEYTLDCARHQLRRGAEPVHLEPRVYDLLCYLVARHDRLVPKEELIDAIWRSQFVSEASLTTAMRAARAAIGDDGSQQRAIRTVHGRGYQFIAELSPTPPSAPQIPSPEAQNIRFCRAADGARIAYATVGSGPVLMKAANWISHLDAEWQTAIWSHWILGLASERQLVRYDERGCGLSDWEVESFTFEDWVRDLETVVDTLGLERFPLLGVSQGGAVAIAYAVRHPERVSALVLAGAYSQGRLVRAATEAERAAAAIDLELARVGWAQQDPSFLRVFASQFLPDGTPDEWSEFIEFQRQTTSPENGVRFLEAFATIDVADIATRVQCPTLILHSRGDVRVPLSQAAELATSIPDSRLVVLDSPNHLLRADEPAWPSFLAHIDDFLADVSS
ncbi:alpha/beta fold hydrolase [Microbacterium sediminicola]|uniref:Alpha/beta fold hydrolase n=1 Tax=Microbacterium sediminicola TaxID=415210 RepID=A0ABN2IHT7_9MICO